MQNEKCKMKIEKRHQSPPILHFAFCILILTYELPIIELTDLTRRYGKLDAVNGLNLTVRPGRCYGFFGRNGAGKTTTIKCLLNLLKPTAGTVRVFGLDPQKDEVPVKSRLCYVPDAVAFYPWMTVRETLNYLASFRPRLERPGRIEPAAPLRFGPGPKNGQPVQRPENATGLDQRHRAGAGIAGAGRADFRAGPDRAPRIHRDGHRRLPVGRPGTSHGLCLHPS